ncbi:MAG: hypothetical protein JNL82_04195 [Myxococcales bacterium]|nr:hypothetical protein [Myxococcales bacterium]
MAAPRLSDEHAARLARGEHEAVAAELAGADQPAAAGWVLEQIWDFVAAFAQHAAAGAVHDALRCALEAGRPDLLDQALAAVLRAGPEDRKTAVATLTRRGRHAEAARLLAADDDPTARADALVRAGDRLGAARLLAEAGRAQAALVALGPLPEAHAPTLALAARLAWDLGDADSCVRHAQAAMRAIDRELRRPPPEPSAPPRAAAEPRGRPPLTIASASRPGPPPPPPPREIRGTIGDHKDLSEGPGPRDEALRREVTRTLAHGLAALGHDLAAALALQGTGEGPATLALPGRYRVRRALPAAFAGAAYEGVDRVSQQEVEVHLLLAEVHDTAGDAGAVQTALAAFERRCEAAQALGHPAIRPVLRFDREAGLLLLPHADGPPLRTLIRPPGMPLTRARALVAFLLDGLAAAHARGIVHGSLLPAQIVCDAAGRPLLGPFGADEIAGLVATRTGALEELLTVTAPELRVGGAATAASDVYGAAALFVALRTGRLGGGQLAPAEQALVADALAEDPAQRPDAATLHDRLRVRVADVRELADAALFDLSEAPGVTAPTGPAGGPTVAAASTWTDADLDALLAGEAPRLQPVLDRHGRKLVLAGWPEGCRRLADDADDRPLRPLLAELPPAVQAAVQAHLRPSSWVYTPGGEWMLGLDDLLTR